MLSRYPGNHFLALAWWLLQAAIVSTFYAPTAAAQVIGFATTDATAFFSSDSNVLNVGLTLHNLGPSEAQNVQVTSATLLVSGQAVVANAPSFPVNLGTLGVSKSVLVSLTFRTNSLQAGARYLLTVRGSYTGTTTPLGFVVNRFVTITPQPIAATVIDSAGGQIVLSDYGQLVLPAGIFATPTNVQFRATSDPEAADDFRISANDMFHVSKRSSYDLRVTASTAPTGSVTISIVVPSSLLGSVNSNSQVQGFIQIFEDGGQDVLDNFELVPSSLANGILTLQIPPKAFAAEHSSVPGLLEAVVTVAITNVPGVNTQANGAVRDQRSVADRVAFNEHSSESLLSNLVSSANGACLAAQLGPPLDTLDVTSPFNPPSHYGTDYAAADGTPVKAMMTGTVIRVAFDLKNISGRTGLPQRGYGCYVIIQADDGSETLYGHLQGAPLGNTCSGISVQEGDSVTGGEVIAFSDNTGGSTGPHLHVEYSPSGAILNKSGKVDPEPCVGEVDHIDISPTSPSVSIAKTITLTATARDATNNILPIGAGNLTWSSANTLVATVDQTGTASGLATGTVTISVAEKISGKSANVTLTVLGVDHIDIAPGNPLLSVSKTVTLIATAKDINNNPVPVAAGNFTWSSDKASIATVDPATGSVTGMTPGAATITVLEKTSGKSGSTIITVLGIDHIEVTPASPTVSVANTVTLTATPKDLNNNSVPVPAANFTWSSDTLSVATVDPGSGIVTGVAPGTATISVAEKTSGKTGSVAITVQVAGLIIVHGGGTPLINFDVTLSLGPTVLFSNAYSIGPRTSIAIPIDSDLLQSGTYTLRLHASNNPNPVTFDYVLLLTAPGLSFLPDGTNSNNPKFVSATQVQGAIFDFLNNVRFVDFLITK